MQLDGPTGTLTLDTKTCPRWVMPNVNGRGYYRTRLTAPQVIALRDEAWSQLSWTEKRSLFFDVSEATRHHRRGTAARAPTTKLPLMLALSLVPKMLTGGDRFTIDDALGLPLGLDRFVADDQRAKYEAWLRATFGPGATKVGILSKDTDDLDAERMRQYLVGAVAWTGRDPELVKQSVELAAGWHDLPQAMRGSVLSIAVDASPELFERILKSVKSEPDRARRGEMIGALGAVRDPKRLAAALALMLDPAIDFRETMSLLYGASNEQMRTVIETFFRAHVDEVRKRMPQDEVAGGLAGVTWLFTGACDAARHDEIVDYVTKTFATLPGGERMVKQAVESMDQCIASRKVLDPELRGWLGGVKIPKPVAAAAAPAAKVGRSAKPAKKK
jgi:alanyl aminopeptidase